MFLNIPSRLPLLILMPITRVSFLNRIRESIFSISLIFTRLLHKIRIFFERRVANSSNTKLTVKTPPALSSGTFDNHDISISLFRCIILDNIYVVSDRNEYDFSHKEYIYLHFTYIHTYLFIISSKFILVNVLNHLRCCHWLLNGYVDNAVHHVFDARILISTRLMFFNIAFK